MLLLAFAAIAPGAVRAQQPEAQFSPSAHLLRPGARAVLAEKARPARTRPVTLPNAAYGRLDAQAHVLRAAYRISERVKTDAPGAMARSYLRAQAAAFGWNRRLAHLKLDTTKMGAGGTRHRVYRQTLAGVPVWRSCVVLSQRADGQPTMIVSGFRPGLADHAPFDPKPRLSAAEARAAARRLVRRGDVRTSVPHLVVYPPDNERSLRLAWRLLAWPSAASAEWEVLVDARSSAVLRVEDQTIRLGKNRHGSVEDRKRGSAGAWESGSVGTFSRGRLNTDGTGFVFAPDPLSTAGVTYDTTSGAPFNDNDGGSTAALRAERRDVTLRGLSQNEEGRYQLVGPYVRITGQDANGNVTYMPPTADTPGGFHFRRSEDGFEAVSAYYHADASRRYAESHGFRSGGRGALRLNPQALDADASRYFPELHFLEMGTGGVDDAEDASVVWHEHAHALLEGAAPGLRASREGQALHEGWADYWSAAHARHLAETGAIQRKDWRRLFKWDSGDGAIWPGRVVRRAGHFPEDTTCDDNQSCDIYRDGLFWAATLMEIYDALGRDVTSRLALVAHGYLAHPVSFRDAAEALIQADRAVYDGAHLSALLETLSERGLAEPSAYGPTLAHDPLPSTEQTGGTVNVTVHVTTASSPVDTVRLLYGYHTTSPSRVLLLNQQEHDYTGALPLPASSDTVRYFIEALDTEGRLTRLPASPGSTYAFVTGADRTAPRIQHSPPDDVALAGWPVSLSARIQDRLALDSVGVRYEIENAQGDVETEGRFELHLASGENYRGVFPVSASQVAPGSRVHYRIYARDAAASANATLQPEDGWFFFSIKKKGLLRTYGFETPAPNLSVEGTRFQDCPTCAWTRALPTYGVQVAHSGRRVIATAPDGAYPASAGRTALDLPALNLRGAPPAYLVFWHWYDFEHDGSTTPESPDTTRLWDGGNVKVSTDGGETWRVAQPQGGYNGTIAEGGQNPLGRQPGFGGYSYAWRRVVVRLPAARDVRVRLEAGFDASNENASLAYAGWYVDDLTVTTVLPADDSPPRVMEAPPSPLTKTTTKPSSVALAARVSDDTGVEDVFTVYRFEDAPPDTVRLAMSSTDRNVFQGTITLAPEHDPDVGDDLTYRLLLRDAGGRKATYPDSDEPPLVVRYRTVQEKKSCTLTKIIKTGRWQSREIKLQGDECDTDDSTKVQLWNIQMGAAAPPRSSLLLRPVFVPDSAESLRFTLLHEPRLKQGTAGNVKIKTEEAERWRVLAPQGGYDGTFEPGADHPMRGESSFRTARDGMVTSTFDLAPYAGQRVQLRLDAGAAAGAAAPSSWGIREATFRFATDQQGFRKPSRLTLDPNYPDPFGQATTLDYVVPDRRGGGRVPVRLDVYDAMGRRVATLVNDWKLPDAYTARFEAGDLASGVYFARLRAGGDQRVEQLVLAR